MQGTLVATLQEAQPTYFFGVPRVWEKFEERIEQAMKDASALRKKLFGWATRVGLKAGYDAMHGYTSFHSFHMHLI